MLHYALTLIIRLHFVNAPALREQLNPIYLKK